MSETTVTTKIFLPADQLPILPETRSIDPIVQCGVLYLGSAPSSTGFHGLDSIQEPFSHRYPVDGTNTVRGIDAVLSIYDNGIQLAFTRQPHTVIFFPISSLIYCASLRFSIIENDQIKPASIVDWRFMPIDTITNNENKHPPLFCAVIQRTQFLSGDECHCFITKSPDAATALVGTISQIYANVKPGTKCLKSPVFYQLDRFGRKLSEITGVIYISPANDDDSQLNQTNLNRLTDESIARNYLFDPSYNGFFYRTDASIIEQWQLWDDDGLLGSRPHPPASPFGLHEGIYHDDTTHEIQQYLRRMDDEEHSCSCNSSSSNSSSCTSSVSTEYSRKEHRHHFNEQKLTDDADQFDESLSNLQTSSFEPVLTQKKIKTKKIRKTPIIIEKLVPKPVLSIPILNPKLPEQLLNRSNSIEESNINYVPSSDYSNFSYRINEYGEKISNDGNRILFMDVVQMNPNNNQIDSQSYIPPISHSRSHRQRSSKKHIPIINIESIERLFNEKNSKNQQHTNINIDNKSKDQLNHTNHLDTIDQYVEDYNGSQTTTQSESSSIKKSQRKSSTISSTTSSKSETRHRHNHSVLTVGPSVNYVERPLISSLNQSDVSSQIKQNSPIPQILTSEKLNEYLSNIYGTARSINSNSSSSTHQDIRSLDNTAGTNANYLSAFRYVRSSVNRNVFEDYRNAY